MNKLTRMVTIYNSDHASECCANEVRQDDMEKRFIEEIVNSVLEAMDVSHRERRITGGLLTTILSDKLNSRYQNEGLLQQYECYVLDKSSKRLCQELNIPEDVKVNHSHATHAKFADIAKFLKEKIESLKLPDGNQTDKPESEQ